MNRKEIAIYFANSLNFPEIEKIILYGSVARGEDNEESDIDILIVSKDRKKTKSKIYDFVTDFLFATEVLISHRNIN
ncbi:MAG: nucleotidyltransferase domain-containing protein [Methanobrevibacter sp.]|jgi:predicted nucleotidyltransferase|nr:nucleotidyltransferase domain-containing protein [Candidatus Methanovirga australis]